MALVNLYIEAITGYTPAQRAEALSRELWNVTRPIKDPNDVSKYAFPWQVHPTTGEAVLQFDASHIIKVHSDKNLTGLIALMPLLTEAQVSAMVGALNTYPQLPFGALIPDYAVYVSDTDLATWFPQEEEI